MNTGYFLMTIISLFGLITTSSAFWFSAEEPKPTSPRLLYPTQDYYRQYVPPPIPYTIPLQVPLPAQYAAPAAVQNVQLVPCLCPVNQEYSYETPQEFSVRKPSAPAVTQQRRK